MEYDDTIVHQMIECVKVYPDGRLDIIFGGGYLIERTPEKRKLITSNIIDIIAEII